MGFLRHKNRGRKAAVFATRKEEKKMKKISEVFTYSMPKRCEKRKGPNIKFLLSYERGKSMINCLMVIARASSQMAISVALYKNTTMCISLLRIS